MSRVTHNRLSDGATVREAATEVTEFGILGSLDLGGVGDDATVREAAAEVAELLVARGLRNVNDSGESVHCNDWECWLGCEVGWL